MRKYRNGKQSREPRRLSKYSPEYIQYRENRGGYSVKVGLCDITGDGEEDTISVAWRNPANGKVQTCAKGYVQSTPPAPSGISALASPQSAPSGISAEISVLPGPTGISVTASPQVAPTGISATEEPNYSFISFEGQTYDLVEEASNGITVTPRTTSSGDITASRVNDDGEILIPISENSLWGSENNQSLYGPVFNFKQSDPEAHYVAISCTSSGNTNIITQNLGAEVFQNGIASRAINKWIAHERNIISGSTTRSKTVVELVWKSISNETIKTEYYKIGFQQLINP
jgi:hypothetical protein